MWPQAGHEKHNVEISQVAEMMSFNHQTPGLLASLQKITVKKKRSKLTLGP